MGETFVTVERRPDDVALVRLDRPKANALSAAVLAQLHAVATTLHDDPPGAVVLWGGRRIFAAGADIVELGDSGAGAVGASFADALGALASVPRATIAAVNGYALGGGLELALACDFRVCAEDSRLGLPEVLLGVLPGGGGTQRLPRLIGSSRAKELIFTGRQVRAEEALSIGLVNRVVAPDDVLEEALTLGGGAGGRCGGGAGPGQVGGRRGPRDHPGRGPGAGARGIRRRGRHGGRGTRSRIVPRERSGQGDVRRAMTR